MFCREIFRLFFLGIVFLFFVEAAAQTSRKSTIGYSKFLLIDVKKVLKKDSCLLTGIRKVNPRIVYDRSVNYYYYSFVNGPRWQTQEEYSLDISNNLKSGYLYIFIVDANNTPRILQMVSLDTLGELRNLKFNCSGKNILLNYVGYEYLSIWFSNVPLIDYKSRIEGIEMTMGGFLLRNKRQTGGYFKEFNGKWFFSKRHIGFYAKKSFEGIKDRFLIPLVIEFKIRPKSS